MMSSWSGPKKQSVSNAGNISDVVKNFYYIFVLGRRGDHRSFIINCLEQYSPNLKQVCLTLPRLLEILHYFLQQ